jgi:hypothetical protein
MTPPHFCDYLPFEKNPNLYLNKLEFPSSMDKFVSSLIENGPLVLEKKSLIVFCVYFYSFAIISPQIRTPPFI